MRRTDIKVEDAGAFFERGRKVAGLADRGKPIRHSRVVAFEDAADLLGLLTDKRVLLLRQVGQTPGSISELARRLHRDRSAVTRDVHLLERYGVVQVTERPLPGHGKQKWITPIARSIQLTARI